MDTILWQWPWELSQKLTNFPKLWNVQPLCGSRKYPYLPFPPHGRSLEIPRGSGEEGFKGSNFWGVGWFMGNYFSKGWRTTPTKHWKQRTIGLKHKNILIYVVLKQKSELPAIEMKLTSFSLLFLFFLWVSYRYNLEKNDVSLEQSRNDF